MSPKVGYLESVADDKQPKGPPKRGAIVLDAQTMVVGGAVALVGIVVLCLFVWMVPTAAARESVAACRGMLADRPISPALCPNKEPCNLPVRAPDFVAFDHNGNKVKLSSLRGKTVLLNFWGSWCGVCKSEKPALEKMAREMSGDDFVVVALASDRSWTDVLLALVESLAPTADRPHGKDISMDEALKAYNAALPSGTGFKVWLDPPSDGSIGSVAAQWGVTAVPDSALIDKDGNLVGYFVNKRDWTSSVAETCLRSAIDKD